MEQKQNRRQIVLTPAQRMVQKLMAISPREEAKAILERVRVVRAYLENPATNAELEEILRDVMLPTPATIPHAWTGFQSGQLVTQPKSEDADGLPRYVFPITGAAALVVGSPSDMDLSGATWNVETRRWEGVDDLKILVSTPDGVQLITVESSAFVPYSPEVSHRDDELVKACLEVLVDLENHFTEEVEASAKGETPENEGTATGSAEGSENA